jgi:hypothetical protein
MLLGCPEFVTCCLPLLAVLCFSMGMLLLQLLLLP